MLRSAVPFVRSTRRFHFGHSISGVFKEANALSTNVASILRGRVATFPSLSNVVDSFDLQPEVLLEVPEVKSSW